MLLAQIRVYTIRRATAGPAEAITARATGGIALVTLCVVALVNIPNFMTFEVGSVAVSPIYRVLGAERNPAEIRERRRGAAGVAEWVSVHLQPVKRVDEFLVCYAP